MNPSSKKNSQRALVVAAMGVVFGDICTSPIYAFRESFARHPPKLICRRGDVAYLPVWFETAFHQRDAYHIPSNRVVELGSQVRL